MDFRRLHHFVTLLDAGTFVAAAARLNITQSALSHSIRSLEEQAEVALFVRGRPRLELTGAGGLLEGQARALLRQMADLRHNLKVEARQEAGTVRFGMAPLPAKLWLTELLQPLLEEPDIVVSASVANGAELTGLLEREYIDFFLCAREGLVNADAFLVEPLASLPLQLMVRRGHPLLQLKRPGNADLQSYPLICMGASFLRGVPNEPAPLFRGGRVAVQSDDYGVLLDLTLGTDAVLLAAEKLLLQHPDSLAAVPIGHFRKVMVHNLVLVRRAERRLSPAGDMVINRLKAMTGAP